MGVMRPSDFTDEIAATIFFRYEILAISSPKD